MDYVERLTQARLIQGISSKVQVIDFIHLIASDFGSFVLHGPIRLRLLVRETWHRKIGTVKPSLWDLNFISHDANILDVPEGRVRRREAKPDNWL